jgi:hypothetical protein
MKQISSILLKLAFALCAVALMSSCVFIKTSLSEEERLRLQTPDQTIMTYVKENLDAARSYVENFDNHGFHKGKRIGN